MFILSELKFFCIFMFNIIFILVRIFLDNSLCLFFKKRAYFFKDRFFVWLELCMFAFKYKNLFVFNLLIKFSVLGIMLKGKLYISFKLDCIISL